MYGGRLSMADKRALSGGVTLAVRVAMRAAAGWLRLWLAGKRPARAKWREGLSAGGGDPRALFLSTIDE